MSDSFKAISLKEGLYWVGAIDWAIRDFHGYSTSRGTTYNAYLIVDDKVTLIDTVKEPFYRQLRSRIESVIDLDRIDYIVSNHAEPDHSGCLPEMIRVAEPEAVFASRMGAKALAQHFNRDLNIRVVKSGETISTGSRSLTFIESRMLHWPDSMVTYLQEDKILFSQDAFGLHLASGERFADELNPEVIDYEMAKYYANILMPYSPLIIKFLKSAQDLDIEWIANDHGPIFRKGVSDVLAKYRYWAEKPFTNRAVVTFDTMWRSTAMMADAVCDGLTHAGISVKQMPLGGSHRSDVATEVLNAGALIVGSPTLNNNIYPTVMDLLIYLKGLKPRNMIGAAFGSYGWGGEAVKQIGGHLSDMGIRMVGDIKVQYVPDNKALHDCFVFGETIAKEMRGETA